ncbi:MAG: hypothetical protein KC425_14680 [Anaerolineales bacterium]|nr:hypothetical protein [Anaerolineales bacterium]
MKHLSIRPAIVWSAIAVIGLVLGLVLVSGLSRVAAQSPETAGTSSAESPADSPAATTEEELERAPDALISWRVTGSALKPRENDVSYTVSSNGACTYVTAGDSSTVWNFAPDLPQGAVVDTLRMYYYDTSGSNSSAWFTVYDLYGSIVDEWNVSSAGNSGNSFNDSGQINHTIDYSIYNYLINWRPNGTGASLQLCGFRVFYEPPPFGAGFLPAIRRAP